ncbi:hypothetical protein GFL91_13980 [Rhizobium leguminosarum bv. viciae]|uniref:OB domain-containing protein n=1 Tax=Rhizobium leguminosarum bv. viciae TaxID=387 RepID=A0A8I2KFR4_RHILV|nr:hypothetical protein [Rhizobium leguminosarum bv. viciae]
MACRRMSSRRSRLTCVRWPRSAKGVTFLTIEDETGPVNVVVWPFVFEKAPPHRWDHP